MPPSWIEGGQAGPSSQACKSAVMSEKNLYIFKELTCTLSHILEMLALVSYSTFAGIFRCPNVSLLLLKLYPLKGIVSHDEYFFEGLTKK